MTDDMVISLNQVVLEMVPVILPASSLPPDEFEARIKAHQERIEREMRQASKPLRRLAESTIRKGARCLPGKLRRDEMRPFSQQRWAHEKGANRGATRFAPCSPSQ